MEKPVIRPIEVDELDTLNQTFSMGSYFRARFADQEAGRAVVMAAWVGERPVGHGYLWLALRPETPQHITANPLVREHLPGVPLLQSLQVDQEYRGKGIGTALISKLEEVAREQGHRRICLGVEPGEKSQARKLYLRLGYRDWPYGTFESSYDGITEEGSIQRFTESSVIMVKQL